MNTTVSICVGITDTTEGMTLSAKSAKTNLNAWSSAELLTEGFSFEPKVMEPFSGCFASAKENLQLMIYAPAMSIKNTEIDVDLRKMVFMAKPFHWKIVK